MKRKFRFLCGVLLVAAMLVPGTVPSILAQSTDILSVAVTNYTGYVMASDASSGDPAFNRESLLVLARTQVTNTTAGLVDASYYLSFRLLDSNNVPFPIFNHTGTATNAGYTYNITNSQFLAAHTSDRNTNLASIRPAARLSPFMPYHVELRLYRFPAIFTGDSSNTVAQTYYHFTNTVSGDTAYNVLSEVDSVNVSVSGALRTQPTRSAFKLNVGYTLRRYDNFAGSHLPATAIPVRISVELRNATNNALVPLKNDATNFTVSVQNYDTPPPSSPYAPAVVTAFREVLVEPTSPTQLDCVSNTFKFVVTIEHTEHPVQNLVYTGNTVATAPTRLVHFNGKLWFGAVPATVLSIANFPTAGTITPTNVASELWVDNYGAFLDHAPSFNFGDGSPLQVRLLPNGDAVFVSGNVAMSEPSDDETALAGVRFQRQNLVLTTNGATANLVVTWPAGFGTRNDASGRVLDPTIQFDNVALTPQLLPVSSLIPKAVNLWGCEETKPFLFRFTLAQWNVGLGRFHLSAPGDAKYVRADQVSQLFTNATDPNAKTKPNNDLYYNSIEAVTSSLVEVQADPNGTAKLFCSLALSNGIFQTHFPLGGLVAWNSTSPVVISNDLVVVGQSSLQGVSYAKQSYGRDCFDEGCSETVGPDTFTLFPANNELRFTREGGLQGAGNLQIGTLLTWGAIAQLGPDKWAHHTTEFPGGSFAMAGTFMLGEDTIVGPEKRPGMILFSGVNPTTLALERPKSPEYKQGFGDYAGMNLRVGQNGAVFGKSLLGGTPYGYYDLTARGKYYVRRGGVSGIHEAVNGSFPTNGTLYGYPLEFSTFGLSFLDSVNVASRTDGAVTLPYPADHRQEFARLKFTCLGAPEEAEISETLQAVTNKLAYWRADFFTRALAFDRRDLQLCDPTSGFLTLGLDMGTGPFGVMGSGTLGFFTNGNLITLADCQGPSAPLDPPFDSRLTVPNLINIRHDDSTSYPFTPVNRAYLNNWLAVTNDFGFLNLPGKLGVTFFEDMLVHAQASTARFTNEGGLKLMGGFPDADHPELNLCFSENGEHFFNTNPFDTANRGFPSGVTLEQYTGGFAKPDDRFRPRARQRWLGIVDMDYPLTWSDGSRDFSEFKGVTRDILILSVEHRCTYLSANKADLEFGTTYNGLGALNPANLLVKGANGYLVKFENTLLKNTLEPAFDAFDKLLAANVQGLFGESVESALRPAITNMVAELKADYGPDKLWSDPGKPSEIIAKWTKDHANPGSIYNRLRGMSGLQGGEEQFLVFLRSNVDHVISALDTLNSFVTASNVAQVDGLLESVQKLSDSAMEKTDGQINLTKIEQLVEKIQPKLSALAHQFLERKEDFEDIRTALTGIGNLTKEIQDIFATSEAILDEVANGVHKEVVGWTKTVKPGLDDPFIYVPKLEAQFMTKASDGFFASAVASAAQRAVKSRVYDPEKLVKEAISSTFEEMNKIVKELLSEALAGLGKKFNNFIGEGGESMAGSGVHGAASIIGDSIHELRLDLDLKLKTPDDMEFHGYVQIKELDSESEGGGCLPPGTMATEVTAGAKDVSVGWVYPNLKASIWGKMTFNGEVGDNNGDPEAGKMRGMAAGFELNGKIKFPGGQFSIDELGSSMGFGKDENYFSAVCKMSFPKGIKGKGGVLFGRVCSLEAFSWDPDVGTLLGEPPFTGAYGYGECWIPISELICPACGCLFQFSAAMGTGVGVFDTKEGPAFVGKLFAGGGGRLLCICTIEGEIKLLGVYSKTGLKLAGSGQVKGTLGFCPLCLDFEKKFHSTYEDGKWHKD